jgi:hypothetical protein
MSRVRLSRSSVPLAGRKRAEVGQDVESLQERLGDRRELLTPADIVQTGHEPVAVAADVPWARVAQDSARLEVCEVSEELFSVEVGERPDLLGIHLASAPKLYNCLED